MANSPKARFRRQIRNFTVIWSGITFIMGATTFIAIYAAAGSLTGASGSDNFRNVGIPTGRRSGSGRRLGEHRPPFFPAVQGMVQRERRL